MDLLTGYVSSSETSDLEPDDNVEEEFRMRIPQSAQPSSNSQDKANVRAQWEQRLQKFKAQQNVKTSNAGISFKADEKAKLLAFPALETLYSSEDDEEDDAAINTDNPPLKKRLKLARNAASANAGGGLLDMLPAPRGLVVKEGKTRQLLVPPSVSRKASAPPAKPAVVKQPIVNKLLTSQPAEEDDDDDDIEEAEQGAAAALVKNFFFSEEWETGKQDATTSAAPVVTYPSLLTANIVGPVEHGPRALPPQRLETSAFQESISSSMEDVQYDHSAAASSSDFALPLNRRNAPVDPNYIVDIHQEDLTAGAHIELTKAISKDAEDQGYMRPDAEDDPGKMAARKHQITWLAYKAKEREFELQNSWAEGRFNRQQNRSKYGF